TQHIRHSPDVCGVIVFVFFFQAEDGIRDRNVTGVQTCALPISRQTDSNEVPAEVEAAFRSIFREWQIPENLAFTAFPDLGTPGRSEERRVGKECRARGGRDD